MLSGKWPLHQDKIINPDSTTHILDNAIPGPINLAFVYFTLAQTAANVPSSQPQAHIWCSFRLTSREGWEKNTSSAHSHCTKQAIFPKPRPSIHPWSPWGQVVTWRKQSCPSQVNRCMPIYTSWGAGPTSPCCQLSNYLGFNFLLKED